MGKSPKKPKPEEIETEPDPTKGSKFQGVVQIFLKTPPRQHQEDVGKGKRREVETPRRRRSKSRGSKPGQST